MFVRWMRTSVFAGRRLRSKAHWRAVQVDPRLCLIVRARKRVANRVLQDVRGNGRRPGDGRPSGERVKSSALVRVETRVARPKKKKAELSIYERGASQLAKAEITGCIGIDGEG